MHSNIMLSASIKNQKIYQKYSFFLETNFSLLYKSERFHFSFYTETKILYMALFLFRFGQQVLHNIFIFWIWRQKIKLIIKINFLIWWFCLKFKGSLRRLGTLWFELYFLLKYFIIHFFLHFFKWFYEGKSINKEKVQFLW